MTHVYSSHLVGTCLEASFALNVTKVTNDVIFLDNTLKLFTEPTNNKINVSVDRLSGHLKNIYSSSVASCPPSVMQKIM